MLLHGRLWDASVWTQQHRVWRSGQVIEHEPTELTFVDAFSALDGLMSRRAVLEDRLGQLAPDERVWATVKRLGCFRGIDTLTALTVHLELGGDWRRFPKARRQSLVH